MPSLLDQDFMLGRDGLPMPRIEPPTDGLLAARAAFRAGWRQREVSLLAASNEVPKRDTGAR